MEISGINKKIMEKQKPCQKNIGFQQNCQILCLQLLIFDFMQKMQGHLFIHDVQQLLMPLKCIAFDFSIFQFATYNCNESLCQFRHSKSSKYFRKENLFINRKNQIKTQVRLLKQLFTTIKGSKVKFFFVTEQIQEVNQLQQFLKFLQQFEQSQFIDLDKIILKKQKTEIIKQKIIYSQTIYKSIVEILQMNSIQSNNLLFIGDLDKYFEYLQPLKCCFSNTKCLKNTNQMIIKLQKVLNNSKIISSYRQRYRFPCKSKIAIQNIHKDQGGLNIQTQDELKTFIDKIYENYSHLRFREVQKIIHRQFLIQNQYKKLEQKVINILEKTGQNYIDNLDIGKKVKIHQENHQKYILYQVNKKKFQNIHQRYGILKKNDINTPQIVKSYQNGLKIIFEFISKRVSDMETDQIVGLKYKFLQILQKIANIDKNLIKSTERVDLASLYLMEFSMEWNFFTDKTQQQTKQLVQYVCKELDQLLAQIPRTVIHSDMNYTNILVEQGQLHLIDYQNIIIGPVIHDLVFLIADKFLILPQSFCQSLIQSYYQILHKKIIYQIPCQTFRNNVYTYAFQKLLRVLFQFCRIYMLRYKSHQLELISLVGQLYYYANKCTFSKQVQNPQLKSSRISKICSIIRQFINRYMLVSSYEKLHDLPKEIFVLFQKNHEKDSALEFMQNNHSDIAVIYVGEILMKNRKSWLTELLNLNISDISDYSCKRIFQQSLFSPNPYKFEQFSEKQIKIIQNINIQKIIKQQNSEVIRQIFCILNKNKQKKMIIKTCNQEIIKQLKQLLPIKVIYTSQWIQNHLALNNNPHKFMLKSGELISWQNQPQKQIKELQSFMDASNITGIILAAGKGSRFGYKQKYLLEFDEFSLLERHLLNFRALGITQVIIGQRHKKISSKKYFQNYPQMNIRYISFEQPIGSGATIIECCKQAKTQRSLIMSGDVFHTLNLSELTYDQNTYYGCILLRKSKQTQAKYVCDPDSNIVKVAAQNQQERNYYNCIGIFQNKCIIQCEPKDQQKYQFGVVLNQLLKQYKIKGIYLDENLNQVLANINTQEEYDETKILYQGLPIQIKKRINFQYYFCKNKTKI